MHQLALAFALLAALPAAPTDSEPDPAVAVIHVDRGQVEETWVTLGDVIFANYYNRALDEHAECAWDRRTREVLYGRNLGVIRCGE